MTDQTEAPKGKPTFEHAICLYRAGPEDAAEPEARVFAAGEEYPAKSEGWVDHPSLIKAKG